MRFTPIAFALLALPAAAGQVRVVGPGHFASIQDAVTTASDGDVILVKQGAYNSARVTGKSVAIVADVNAAVTISGAIRVRDTSAMQPVVIAGLTVYGIGDIALPELMSGLYASNCDGSIVVQDCTLTGSNTIQTPCLTYTPRGGAEILDCSSVAFARCTLTGNVGRWNAAFPIAMGAGLASSANSIVSFDHGTAAGGHGGAVCSGYEDGSSGGHGVSLKHASALFATGSTFLGANGVPAPFPPTLLQAQVSGSGGNGLVHEGTGSSPVWLLASSTIGGAAGLCAVPGSSTCADGLPGSATSGNTTITIDTASFAPKLTGPGIARDVDLPEFRVDAPPGARVELGLARWAGFTPDPVRHGVQHLVSPKWLRVGVVPAGGNHAKRRIALPDLTLGNPGAVLYLQARVTTLAGETVLSNPHALVVVDATY